MASMKVGWRNWGDHPVVVIVSAIAALLAIFAFATGNTNLPSMLFREDVHRMLTEGTTKSWRSVLVVRDGEVIPRGYISVVSFNENSEFTIIATNNVIYNGKWFLTNNSTTIVFDYEDRTAGNARIIAFITEIDSNVLRLRIPWGDDPVDDMTLSPS